MWKESRTARVRRTQKAKAKTAGKERDAKKESKKRDGWRCRFPLCGCRKFALRLESSHQKHKGMGGNAKGDRNTTDNLITFCTERHQFGRISRTSGTLLVEPLTRKGCDGPVKFSIDIRALSKEFLATQQWREVARESAIQQLEPLTDWQRDTLELLAKMEL